ncbi:MAG: hypothetical protein Q8K79_00775 [Solirubrobacteraceae bacterium]|nr:hypothetical protein [Solirubrobacteraceae bacterium]
MTRSLRHILAALACLALCGALLAACGEDEEKSSGARGLLDETFGSGAAAIENGRLDVDFQLDPKGLLALGGPIKLSLDGPFSSPDGGELPHFDVDFAATLAGDVFEGAVLSTGRAAFVRLDGTAYKIDREFVAELREGLADAADEKQPGLKALGVDPLRWISNAQERGNERIDGVETTRISGDVEVAKLLEDIDRLLTKAGGSGDGGDLLSPKIRQQISAAVKSAKADIWTGTSDKILRQLAVRISFAFDEGEKPITGLDSGIINLRLRLADVNKTSVSVDAPAGARPLDELTGGGIGAFLDGIGNGLSGKGTLATGQFLGCITGSGGNSADLVSCISKLAD